MRPDFGAVYTDDLPACSGTEIMCALPRLGSLPRNAFHPAYVSCLAVPAIALVARPCAMLGTSATNRPGGQTSAVRAPVTPGV
jgi:hypothetical protein